MSSIIATNDLINKKWNMSVVDLGSVYAELQFRFTKQTQTVVFNNLSFGYELFDENNQRVDFQKFPRPGLTYESTDQLFIELVSLHLKAFHSYTLNIWSHEEGVQMDVSFKFKTSQPQQPFPSWKWKDQAWFAPVARPAFKEGEIYTWDESQQIWNLNPSLATNEQNGLAWNSQTLSWEKVPDYEVT
jgi:hypothetical protein